MSGAISAEELHVQFSIRDGLWLTTVVALVMALLYSNRSAQPTPLPAPIPAVMPIGRYQLMSDPKSGYVFMLDTATGKVWRYSSGSWTKGELPVD